MPIKVICPQCAHSLTAPDHFAGKVAGCPACKAKIKVPAGDGPSVTTAKGAPKPAPAPQAASRPPLATPLPSAAKSPPARPSVPAPPIPAPPRAAASVPPLPARPSATGSSRAAPSAPLSVDEPAGGDLPFSIEEDLGLSGPRGGSPALATGRPAGPPPLQGAKFKQKKKKNANLLIYAAVGSSVVLATVAVAAYFVLSGGAGGSLPLRYLPDNANFVAHIDWATVHKSRLFKKLSENIPGGELPTTVPNTKISVSDIAGMTAAGAAAGGEPLVIVHFNRALKDSDLGESKKSEKIGSFALHHDETLQIGKCLVDDHTGIIGKPDVVRTILKRNGDAKFSASLSAAIAEAHQSSSFWFAASGTALADFRKEIPANGAPFDIRDIKGFALDGNIGSGVDLRAAVILADAEKAKQIKALADVFLPNLTNPQGLAALPIPLPDDAKQAVTQTAKSISVTQSGSTIHASISLSEKVIETFQKIGAGGMQAEQNAQPPAAVKRNLKNKK